MPLVFLFNGVNHVNSDEKGYFTGQEMQNVPPWQEKMQIRTYF